MPFWRGLKEPCFYQEFYAGIVQALRELGHEALQFPYADVGKATIEEANALYRLLAGGNVAAVLDLACWSCGLSRLTIPFAAGGRRPIFDAFGIPYVGLLFDQPFNQGLNVIVAQALYAAYPDRGHPEQVRLVYPSLRLRGEIFAPPAVRLQNDRAAPDWADGRDIDVLYVGNLLPEFTERIWRDRTARRWPAGFDPGFCDALADTALAPPARSLVDCVRAVTAARGSPPSGFDYHLHLRVVEYFLRYVLRRDAVAAMAASGTRMRIVGKGWDSLSLPHGAEIAPPTDYDGIFRLAGRAKVCLDASTYFDGANDRVFGYALNRAVCFTNAAGYLREAMGTDGGIRFYSMNGLAELADAVGGLIARPAALRRCAEQARAAVLEAHTWRRRVETILGAIGPPPSAARPPT